MSIFSRFFGRKNNLTVSSDIKKKDARSRNIAFVDTEVGLKDHKIHDIGALPSWAVWHWNKKYWNQVNLYGTLEDDFIQSLIRHSYSEVVKKLKKKEKLEHPEIMVVVE